MKVARAVVGVVVGAAVRVSRSRRQRIRDMSNESSNDVDNSILEASSLRSVRMVRLLPGG